MPQLSYLTHPLSKICLLLPPTTLHLNTLIIPQQLYQRPLSTLLLIQRELYFIVSHHGSP
jgi:hypothetical protein